MKMLSNGTMQLLIILVCAFAAGVSALLDLNVTNVICLLILIIINAVVLLLNNGTESTSMEEDDDRV